MAEGLSFEEVEFGSRDYWRAVQLRRRLLRLPLGLDFTPEDIGAEAGQTHLVARSADGGIVAVALLVPVDERTAKMRQVAVEPEFQRRGIGAELVRYFERVAAEKGYERIELNARDTAVDFYLRLGYWIDGEPFEEVTIPHRKMVKRLSKV